MGTTWTDGSGYERSMTWRCGCGHVYTPEVPDGGPKPNTQYHCPACGAYNATYLPNGPQPGESPEAIEMHRARGWRQNEQGDWALDPELAAANAKVDSMRPPAVDDPLFDEHRTIDSERDLRAFERERRALERIRAAKSAATLALEHARVELWARIYAIAYERSGCSDSIAGDDADRAAAAFDAMVAKRRANE